MLVADETAVPSVAAILDSWGGADDARDHGVEVHVEVADPAVLAAYDLGDATVHRRAGRPGSALVPALQAGPAAAGGPVALRVGVRRGGPGRRRAARAAARHGADRRSIFTCGYWKLGRARPSRPHHATGRWAPAR